MKVLELYELVAKAEIINFIKKRRGLVSYDVLFNDNKDRVLINNVEIKHKGKVIYKNTAEIAAFCKKRYKELEGKIEEYNKEEG